jgi:aarF domain-containing kinase
MFPEELCRALSQLHSNAPTHKPAHTRQLVERTFGNRKIEEVFDWFSMKPMASGSIAQVCNG